MTEGVENVINRIRKHNFHHCGFSNGATFLAHLYLDNDREFHDWLMLNRRKDGSVSPAKVEKQFRRLCYIIDDWAYDFPSYVSDDIASLPEVRDELRKKTSIRWEEVAESFLKASTS